MNDGSYIVYIELEEKTPNKYYEVENELKIGNEKAARTR